MISITAILKSKPENTAQIKNMLTHLVTETRKEEACIRYDLHHSENIFIIWEEWIKRSPTYSETPFYSSVIILGIVDPHCKKHSLFP